MTANDTPLRLLFLGASYAILPAMRIAQAGHHVTLVGREDEITAMAQTGLDLALCTRETGAPLALHYRTTLGPAPDAGTIGLVTPQDAQPVQADMIVLAMQEPQYRIAPVTKLMERVAHCRRPCLSLMNMPPPPFLDRLNRIDTSHLADAYYSAPVWEGFDPERMTLASPDAQAMRPDPNQPGTLKVTLATNFKVAPFARTEDQALLTRLARDVAAVRVPDSDGNQVTPRVRLVDHGSLTVALAKWPMLIAGNCRCLISGGPPISISEAIWHDIEESREIYDWVCEVARGVGAGPDDLVSFDCYADAARGLTLPSSAARALHAGAPAVERIDRLIQMLAAGQGLVHPALERIVSDFDAALANNTSLAS